jgi:hypothetical protein
MPSRQPKFKSWTAIAARERDSPNVWMKLEWIPFPDAAVTPEQARVLGKIGRLLVANAHDAEHVYLMVRSPQRR